MADVATPSTPDAGASTPVNDKKNVAKPERPDQAAYEKELAEAEKQLKAALERQVSRVWLFTIGHQFNPINLIHPLYITSLLLAT